MSDQSKKATSLIRRLVDIYFSAQLGFRVRLFNVLALAGTLVAFTIGCVTLVTRQDIITTLVDWASAAVSFGLLYYAMKTQKYVRCYYITIVMIFLGLFPYLYFAMGGYKGGMSSFFIFAIVFTAFMLEKKAAYITLLLELVVYASCFVISFIYPTSVRDFNSEYGYFINSFIDFLTTAASLAVIALMHFRLYNAQQRKLDEQNTVLTQINHTKTEFLANASHEMRTPLTVTSVNVQTVMEILEDTGENLKDPEAIKLLKGAQSEIMRLGRMVSGMLTLASMSESMDRKRLDFTALMHSGIEMLRLNLEKRGNCVSANIESGLIVFGNADLLAQVLSNILQNAGANTLNGSIKINANKQGNEIIVETTDTGTGISPEILPHVFERGVSTGGTGYGLYLCKTVVESHGGKIWIESRPTGGLQPENGTTVYYTLPFYEGQFGGMKT